MSESMNGYVIDPAPPYISQLEPTGLGYNNCGPTVLAMQLAHRGIIAPDQGAMHYVADIVRDGVPNDAGTWWNTYTTFTQLINCAGWFGISTVWCDTWDDVRASIRSDEPVCLLVYNAILQPRQYPQGPAFDANHFIMLYGYDDDQQVWYVGDPLRVYEPRSYGKYTYASILEASRRTGGVQAYGFVPINALVEDEEMALTADERAALAQLRALAWGADSIVNAINRIGALEQVVNERTQQRDALQGLFEERGRQITDLETEVRSLKDQVAGDDVSKYALDRLHLIWKDSTERFYDLQDTTDQAAVQKKAS